MLFRSHQTPPGGASRATSRSPPPPQSSVSLGSEFDFETSPGSQKGAEAPRDATPEPPGVEVGVGMGGGARSGGAVGLMVLLWG